METLKIFALILTQVTGIFIIIKATSLLRNDLAKSMACDFFFSILVIYGLSLAMIIIPIMFY